MSAFLIGRAQSRDMDGMRRYGALVTKASLLHPNQPLVRAGRYQVLEGPDEFDRYAILRFPSVEAALAYYNSPEYQEAAAVRLASTRRCETVIVEGVE